MSGAIETATGKSATIRFDGSLCIHARRCVLAQPGVFKANVEGPWIDPDAASPDELMQVAINCPSGAIRVTRHDGGPQEANPKVNTITIRENGPLAVYAEIDLAGERIGYRATLCRCGESKNKPYCDGSHVGAAFVSTGEPPTATSAAARQARRPPGHHALPERTARRRRPGRDLDRYGPHHRSRRRDRALPLRPFGPKALLRRKPREIGFVAP